MPKIVSARLENDRHQELLERCNKVGCRVNDFVKASIEFALKGTTEFDFGDEDDKGDKCGETETASSSDTRNAAPADTANKIPRVILRMD